jgi:sentrin-specific protease 1
MVATKSRYVWKNAMEGLEKIPSSRDKKVSSWEEAKESLKQVIRFVEEEGLEAHASDDIAEKYGKKMDSEMDQMKDDLRNMNLSGREKWQTVSSFFDVNTDEGLEVWAAQTKADLHFNARIKDAEERDQRYRQSEAVKELEERQKLKEAQERARSLMRPFTGEEQQIIRAAIYGHGPEDEIIAQCGSDSVLRRSMQTLQPGQWLNDEVIHYFYLMLANRDAERSKLDPSTKRSHFFKSFFMTKLLNEGNVTRDGEYEYSNVKRWSKKVPGKDIFALDKIIFPINMGQMHWICSVIFMAKKKIQIFDSLGSSGQIYLEALFRYLQDEHVDKKKKPLPDQDQWELIPTTSDTPRQRNGTL